MVGDSAWFVVITEEELHNGEGIGSWTEFNKNIENLDLKVKNVIVEEDKSYKSYPDWVLTHPFTNLLTHPLTHSCN